MCSFVAIKAHSIQLSLKKDERLNIFSEILDVKGGDEYNFVFINENTRGIHYISNYEFYTELQSLFSSRPCFTSSEKLKVLKRLVEQKNYTCGTFIAFSRATPEMESDVKTLSQPYIDVYNGTVSVCHGTIPKADQIAKDLNCKIQVDTELFLYNYFETVLRMNEYHGGKVSALQYNVKDNNIIMYHNGLGLYQYNVMVPNSPSVETWISNINLSIDTRKAGSCAIEKRVLNQGFIYEKFDANTFDYLDKTKGDTPPFRLISLHSGGLDISLSVQKVLDDLSLEYGNGYNNSVDLLYFDWGTRAREGEIRSGKDLIWHLKNKFSDVANSFQHHTLRAKDFFKNYLGMLEVENCRLTDKNAVGAGEAEAEAAISYVPYRNTILLTAAAAWAEQKYPNERCIFVIGANLSEGMVYLDNSETYITLMNQLVKVGGQKSALFEVRAPYMNYTKTKMVKDADANGFSLHSFSCYFPKEDGTECGECGSCLLKNTAIKRAKNK